MKKLLLLFIFALVCTFTACIPFDDLGEYWEKGTIDPELKGDWKKMGVKHRVDDEYISYVLSGDHYLKKTHSLTELPNSIKCIEPTSPFNFRIKTLQLGKHKFLMQKEEDSQGETTKGEKMNSGALTRYKVENNILYVYCLDDSVIAKAIKNGEVEGRLPKRDDPNVDDLTPPTIKKLDDTSIELIKKWANQKKYWKVRKYQRVKDLKSAMKKSRSYPATKDTPKNSLVKINQPDLKYFAEGKSNILLRHLKASPEWSVENENGNIVCYRRKKGKDFWKTELGWDERDEVKDGKQIRFVFRFAKQGGGPFRNEFNYSYFKETAPLAGNIYLNLKSSSQGIESYLAIGQKGLWFEFFEQRDFEPRIYTREALIWLNKFLKTVRESEDEVKSKGYVSSLMGGMQKKNRKPSLEVIDSFQGGLFNVYAWINPAKSGYVYLKAFDVKKGTSLSEKQLTRRSTEYTGWSKDKKELFYYNTNITIYEGDWSYKYDARFELWFHPDDGTPEKKLLELTRKISGWQR